MSERNQRQRRAHHHRQDKIVQTVRAGTQIAIVQVSKVTPNFVHSFIWVSEDAGLRSLDARRCPILYFAFLFLQPISSSAPFSEQIFPRLHMDTEIVARNECHRTNRTLSMSTQFGQLFNQTWTTQEWFVGLHVSICVFATKCKF